MNDQAKYAAEIELQQKEQQRMNRMMPEAKEGTLPPLYFATASSITSTNKQHTTTKTHTRRPSYHRNVSTNNLLKRTTSLGTIKHSSSSRKNLDVEDTKSTLGYPPSKPMHRIAEPSYLSYEASAVQNYRGFFNLLIIILIVSNVRMIVGSIRNHGFILKLNDILTYLYELPSNIMNHPDPWSEFPFISSFLLQLLFIFMAYSIEVLLSKQYIRSEWFGILLHHINGHSALLIPIWIVWNYIDRPPVAAILLLHATTTWMKIISYFLANQDYRLALKLRIASEVSTTRSSPLSKSKSNGHLNREMDTSQNSGSGPIVQNPHEATLLSLVQNLDENEMSIAYPQNITLRNLLYFWCCPSLTYQIAFPKTKRRRYLYICGIIMRMIVSFTLFTFIGAQIVHPTLQGLLNDLEATKGTYTFHMMAEYWLRLSVANTYLWLLMFYFYFHLYLNLLAEVLRFGDRVFYKDWWNSAEVSAFWRLWNRKLFFFCYESFRSILASFFRFTSFSRTFFFFSFVVYVYNFFYFFSIVNNNFSSH